MATRLYLHASEYNRSYFGGSYNQGTPMTVAYAGDYNTTSNTHVAVGRYDPDLLSVPAYFSYTTDEINWNVCTLSGGAFPTQVYVTEVRWLNDTLWCAGDAAGRIYTSTNGQDWTLRYTDPQGLYVERIRYGNGYYVAVTDSPASNQQGSFIYSTDGITWAQATNTGNGNIIGVDYSPSQGKWIAVGAGGATWTTTNPAGTWTQTIQGGSARYYIMRDDTLGLWVTSGAGGLIETSTDGAVWTSRAVGGVTGNLWSITKLDNGTFFMCGVTGYVLKSTNLTTWTTVSPSPTPLPDAVNSYFTVWQGEPNVLFVTGDNGFLYKSTDNGVTWSTVGAFLPTASTTIPTPSRVSLYDMTATRLRLMNNTLGTAQQTFLYGSADISTAQRLFIGMFASYPLASAQTVGGGSMTLNTAQNASSAAAAFQVTSMNVYVWRPSTSAKVGTVKDGSAAALGGAAGGTSETVQNITGITTSAISAQAGDIIVCEIWANFTQSMATAYTMNFYYDGTTVNTTQGATVTNHASFIELTETLTFSTTPINPSGGGVKSRSFFVFFN